MKSDLQIILDDAEAITLSDFQDALIGHSVESNLKAIYDVSKMIKLLVDRENITSDEAWEWLEYNLFPDFNPNQKINHPIFFYPFENV